MDVTRDPLPLHLGPMLPPDWQRYRDGFAALQLVHVLSRQPAEGPVSWPRVVRSLGFTPREAEMLRRYLLWNGCLDVASQERGVRLTRAAVDYLEGRHGRRCSVRPRAV